MRTFRLAGRHLLQDARHFQILFQAAFLCYGIGWLGWDAELGRYALVFGTALGVQAFFIRWKGLPASSWKSAMITALGLSLLLKAGGPLTLVLAATTAIASKFFIRFNGKHVFNPGNLGIVLAALLTGDAWVSPGQWGSGALLVFLVGAAGSMVVLRVGRIDISVAFLGAFAALEFARTVLYLGWGTDVWLHKLSSGSLLLFTFFMITDPMTTPDHRGARIAWSMAVAAVAFLLSWKLQVYAAPIWALVLLSPLTPLFDRFWKGERFQWIRPDAPRLPRHATSN
ncbi:MAG: RnfABCDGE type electron transport complex subunit D [Flavobacteriales bacterium]|nr:RnfABCDGE type electron transport complex subunit D [Flavobacteriales bacterium]